MYVLIIILLLLPVAGPAQDLSERPLQKLIDAPSAGGPETGTYDFELRAFPAGGILIGFTVGLLPRSTVGVYYGGTGIIGYSAPDWNPYPGVTAALRLVNESILFPALSIGFTNQGFGAYIDTTERYQFKAKGFYAVVSKNYSWGSLGEMGIHLGGNQNPVETGDGKVDLFLAFDIWLTTRLALIGEYSAALDDWKSENTFGEGKGYLNAGLRLSLGERLAIDLHLRDLLNNQQVDIRGGRQIGREVRISYVESLN